MAPCGYRPKSTYQNRQLYKTKPVGTKVSIASRHRCALTRSLKAHGDTDTDADTDTDTDWSIMRMNLSSQPGRHTVEIIMKCQTCVRARLRHLTWPINLGLIGLCHNKTEIHIQIQIQIQLQTQLQIQMQRRYTTSDIDVHSLLISPPFFLLHYIYPMWWWFLEICHIYRRTSDRSGKIGRIPAILLLLLSSGILARRHFIRFFNCVKHFWILHVRNSETPKLVKILLSLSRHFFYTYTYSWVVYLCVRRARERDSTRYKTRGTAIGMWNVRNAN